MPTNPVEGCADFVTHHGEKPESLLAGFGCQRPDIDVVWHLFLAQDQKRTKGRDQQADGTANRNNQRIDRKHQRRCE